MIMYQKKLFYKSQTLNHNVLPRTIIEDQLDKQSSDLAKCFFSADVENVLYKNKNYSKATFVRLTRNWYEACDKHGIATIQETAVHAKYVQPFDFMG